MRIAEIDNGTFLLLVLVGTLVLCIGATVLFRSTVPSLIARAFRTEDAERRYIDLLKEGHVVRDRVRTLQSEFNQLESLHDRMESDLRKIQRQLNSAATNMPDFIHEVGDARSGQTKFVARLSVESESSYLRTTSDHYNPMWHYINLAEVWASSKDEARQLLELAYSEKLGYIKAFTDNRFGKVEDIVR